MHRTTSIFLTTTILILYGIFSLYLQNSIKFNSNSNESELRRLQQQNEQHAHSGDNLLSPHPHLHHCPAVRYISGIHNRADIGELLKNENKTVGVELGVQRGEFFNEMMSKWQIAQTYVFVDIWAHQENYQDGANVDQSDQDTFMNQAITYANNQKAAGHLQELVICRNFTVNCVLNFPDHHFDFIYVDARHDYKGVLVDLQKWWPKLKRGGIMAGHDYIYQIDIDILNRNYKGPREDWTLNYDGTRDETGRVVKGAVDDFFSDVYGDMHGCPRQTTISYREPHIYVSWYARK